MPTVQMNEISTGNLGYLIDERYRYAGVFIKSILIPSYHSIGTEKHFPMLHMDDGWSCNCGLLCIELKPR
jgi:hypothetical protein